MPLGACWDESESRAKRNLIALDGREIEQTGVRACAGHGHHSNLCMASAAASTFRASFSISSIRDFRN